MESNLWLPAVDGFAGTFSTTAFSTAFGTGVSAVFFETSEWAAAGFVVAILGFSFLDGNFYDEMSLNGFYAVFALPTGAIGSGALTDCAAFTSAPAVLGAVVFPAGKGYLKP